MQAFETGGTKDRQKDMKSLVPRLILIDQSIKGVGGHHYEYAARVLSAASDAGYHAVLATHRDFKKSSTGTQVPWPVVPVYRVDYWGSESKPFAVRIIKALIETIRAIKLWARERLRYSTLGLFLVNRHRLRDFARAYVLASATPWLHVMLLAPFYYCARCALALYRFAKAAFPFKSYTKAVFRAFRRLLATMFEPALIVLHPPEWFRSQIKNMRHRRAFLLDTRALFRKVKLKPQDVVFVPTIGQAELLGLGDYLGRLRNSNGAWHLLFRRSLYEGRKNDYQREEELLRSARNAYRRFADLARRQTVYFYTDTRDLTHQYNRFRAFSCTTLPIPSGDDYLQAKRPRRSSTRISYVGDARTEKGYHFLPRLITDLRQKSADVEFCIQSNYNSAHGEPAPVVARNQLEAMSDSRLKINPKAMTSAEYRDQVISTDIMLIPYDPGHYYARSSGIFSEALAAGVPVVVPAGTWMAAELGVFQNLHADTLRKEGVVTAQFEAASLLPKRPRESQVYLDGRTQILARVPVTPRSHQFLLFTMKLDDTATGDYIAVTVRDKGSHGTCLFPQIVGGRPGRCSIITPLMPTTVSVEIVARNAYGDLPIVVSQIGAEVLAFQKHQPCTILGTVYSYQDQIEACVSEILNNYEHYENSARTYASQWWNFHNAHNLVKRLTDGASDEKEEPALQIAVSSSKRSTAYSHSNGRRVARESLA